jgi:site-specific DNA-cytosine methylase
MSETFVVGSLCANGKAAGSATSQDAYSGMLIPDQYSVRRLMPIEAERLMGFPDDYTAIAYRGKPAADSPRYKALGNSWAVNSARWVFTRIQMVEASGF